MVRVVWLVFAGIGVPAVFGATVRATPQSEGFDAAPAGGLTNSFFQHNVQAHEVHGIGPFSTFQDFEFVSAGHSLFLVGTDYITFNLLPGEWVDYAEVWFKGYGAPATFHVLGLDGMGMPTSLLIDSAASGAFVKVDTSAGNFAHISEIRLSGLEGAFDDLVVRVVPEPATLILFALGWGALLMRRRVARFGA